jgi:hypothetical protein
MNEFTKWNGGPCPCGKDDTVDTELRAGIFQRGVAGELSWGHQDRGSDIVGWRMVKEVDRPDPLQVQVGGGHYKDMAIQPVEFIHANGIGYFEGNVVKYVSRWRKKNGVADLEKARHYIDLLIELEGRRNPTGLG